MPSGMIYEMNSRFLTDDGVYIRRLRRTPHIAFENVMLFFQKLEVVVESGLGLNGLDTTDGTDPHIMVRWSDDGGKSWSNEEWMDMGKIGEYRWRAKLEPLGQARDRVFELVITDPIPVRIIDGFINFNLGKR